MYVNAIEEVKRFTRPIFTITRNYQEKIVSPGAATFFFVNEIGCAITCKHVIDLIGNKANIYAHYNKFLEEKAAIGKNNYNKRVKDLEARFNLTSDSIIQLEEQFLGVSQNNYMRYHWINHPIYDLSIIVFDDFEKPAYESHAVFVKDSSRLKQGKFLCRLGFPFPEFTNYRYNDTTDNIEWIAEGHISSPIFPIEGMLTRHILEESGKTVGIELSTPGLRGQSGGPLFDENGFICGMQSATNHLHLGFDMKNFEYRTGGKKIKVNNQPFLHVGHCIHADIIKEFLTLNSIKFYEE